MTNNTAIELRGVTVSVGGKTPLDDFDLRVGAGERVTLSGRSGSGKTTVLRTILGFVVPDAGEVMVEGEALTPHSVWDVRRRVAYVAQEPELGRGTAREVLERPFEYRANMHLRENLHKMDTIAKAFLLDHDLLDRKVEDLSGGEKQRVAIISALLLDRKILLLDEASSALDPDSKAAVAERLRGDESLTILSVSHDAQGFDIGGRKVSLTNGAEAAR